MIRFRFQFQIIKRFGFRNQLFLSPFQSACLFLNKRSPSPAEDRPFLFFFSSAQDPFTRLTMLSRFSSNPHRFNPPICSYTTAGAYNAHVMCKWKGSPVPGNVFKISKDKNMLAVQHADPIPMYEYEYLGRVPSFVESTGAVRIIYVCSYIYLFSWVPGLPDHRSFGIVNHCISVHYGNIVVFERATCSGWIRVGILSRKI